MLAIDKSVNKPFELKLYQLYIYISLLMSTPMWKGYLSHPPSLARAFRPTVCTTNSIWATTCHNQQNECEPSEDSGGLWAFAQSDQSLRSLHEERLGP